MRAVANDEVRRLAAEALGTASLLAAIVGSGIVVTQDGNAPAQQFQHAVVVGAALTALILAFGSVSGAHFNPAVTIADAWFGGMSWGRAGRYVAAQVAGAAIGTAFTNATFGLPAIAIAATPRPGLALAAAEAAATAGLLIVVFDVVRSGGGRVVAGAVGAYIAAAIMFTASAAFANPAVTLARVLTTPGPASLRPRCPPSWRARSPGHWPPSSSWAGSTTRRHARQHRSSCLRRRRRPTSRNRGARMKDGDVSPVPHVGSAR